MKQLKFSFAIQLNYSVEPWEGVIYTKYLQFSELMQVTIFKNTSKKN